MREEGYYWVKLGGKWIIIEFIDKDWWVGGFSCFDSEFDEIDERRITRVDVKAENAKNDLTPDYIRKTIERDFIKFGLFGNPQDHEPEKHD